VTAPEGRARSVGKEEEPGVSVGMVHWVRAGKAEGVKAMVQEWVWEVAPDRDTPELVTMAAPGPKLGRAARFRLSSSALALKGMGPVVARVRTATSAHPLVSQLSVKVG